MDDLMFAAAVSAGPVGLLVITAPHLFDPPPAGLAGWVPHIVVGLVALLLAARWISQGNKE